MKSNEPYFSGKICVFVTMHEKESAVLPSLDGVQGLNIQTIKHINTDILGTFSGEIERQKDPLQTAIDKAELAKQFASADLALSSEGAFGPHPSMFFIPADQEWLVLKDLKADKYWAIHHISTNTNFNSIQPKNWDEIADFLSKIQFPSHGIIIKVLDKVTSSIDLIFKDINLVSKLKEIYQTYHQVEQRTIILETDMRAHRNPTRMMVIAEAAEKLKSKLNSLCPSCAFPGFDTVEVESGLPCKWCKSPTRLIYRSLLRCQHCNFEDWKLFPQGSTEADPGNCDVCNP
jgi:hypothetical protein